MSYLTEITKEEAKALLKILDEVDYVGFGEFARLSQEEELAVRRGQRALARIAEEG